MGMKTRKTRIQTRMRTAGPGSSSSSAWSLRQPSFATIGTHPLMKGVAAQVRLAAKHDAPVLIAGEQGTGRTWLAKMMHMLSPRAPRPCWSVPCHALPEDLLDGELFGHVRAEHVPGGPLVRPGVCEGANGGTVVLQEIEELPFSLQDQILRLLREKTVIPVCPWKPQPSGSLEELTPDMRERALERMKRWADVTKPRPIDIRLMATTKGDLRQAVTRGAFREELWRYFHEHTIVVPPLRARRSDIPALVQHFFEKHGSPLDGASAVAGETLPLLMAYDWPRNVEELETRVREYIAKRKAAVLQLDDFPALEALSSLPPRQQRYPSTSRKTWTRVPDRLGRKSTARRHPAADDVSQP